MTMKIWFLAIFALLPFIATASDVIELTDDDFDDEIAQYDFILVEFFAPWCGHCKKLAPEYAKAATTLKNDKPPIHLASVDCIANSGVCSKHGVSGYPTMKIFRNGVASDYGGPREADGIVSFLRKQAGPSSRELETMEDYDDFMDNWDPVAVGYFEDASALALFMKAASALREDYKFAHTQNADIMAKAGYTDVVVLHRPKRLKSIFEEQQVVMDADKPANTANLRTFLGENSFGLCHHATADNFGKFKKPLVVAFDSKIDYVKNPKGSNYWRNRVMKWGKDFADQLNFAVANTDDFGHQLPEEGLPENDESSDHPKPIVLIFGSDSKKYIMPELFSKTAFADFLTAFLAGEVTPHIKSETPPEDNDGPVAIVTGKTFDDIVMDEDKDVLTMFYAPWCGHCKKLEPTWDELGEKIADNPDIVIAKIDATANDSPSQFAVSGFPTIYWSPKGDKANPTKYSGGRDLSDFTSFLSKNSDSWDSSHEEL